MYSCNPENKSFIFEPLAAAQMEENGTSQKKTTEEA